MHPDYLTRRFTRPCAGTDLKTVQEQLGPTSVVLTADTYTSVLHEQHVKAAASSQRSSPSPWTWEHRDRSTLQFGPEFHESTGELGVGRLQIGHVGAGV